MKTNSCTIWSVMINYYIFCVENTIDLRSVTEPIRVSGTHMSCNRQKNRTVDKNNSSLIIIFYPRTKLRRVAVYVHYRELLHFINLELIMYRDNNNSDLYIKLLLTEEGKKSLPIVYCSSS